MDTEKPTQKASRQCWECHKRRLVCDYTMPHCKKCLKKGRECPGYDAQKPLQWVETGKITSRKRTKPSKRAELVVPVFESKSSLSDESHSDTSGSLIVNRSEDEDIAEAMQIRFAYQRAFSDKHSIEEVNEILQLGNRDKIEEVLEKGLVLEAAKMLKIEKDPLKGLRRILRYIRLENLPTYNLQSEASEVVQAIQYFNTRVIPESTGSEHTLVHNPQIMLFPISALHLLPPATHSSFVCIALQHYIRRLPPGASQRALITNGPKIWQYRGNAIRELRERVADQRTMYSFTTMTSVVVFLTNEMQTQMLPDWRTHVDVFMRIIKVHGGLMEVYRNVLYMHPAIVLFHLVVVSSNSTSPALEQVVLAPTLQEELENVEEMFHELFPFCLCPPPIFFYIIRISHLRREASQAIMLQEDLTDLCLRATDLLSQIRYFSVNDWAQPGDDFDDWLAIGSVYKYATAVYCIMSLQDLGLLPMTTQLIAQLERYGDLLVAHLKTVCARPRLYRFALWPLAIAGAEAGYRGEARRKWIDDCCESLAQSLGTNCPFNVRVVMRRYWNVGKPGWEECFNRPLAFMF